MQHRNYLIFMFAYITFLVCARSLSVVILHLRLSLSWKHNTTDTHEEKNTQNEMRTAVTILSVTLYWMRERKREGEREFFYVFVPLYLQKMNASPPQSSTSKSTEMKLAMQRGDVVAPLLLVSKIEQVQHVLSLPQCSMYLKKLRILFVLLVVLSALANLSSRWWVCHSGCCYISSANFLIASSLKWLQYA